jgi:hypothetical protein
MSKKLYSTAKWKRYLRSRQLYQLKRLQKGRHNGHAYQPSHAHPSTLPFATLRVPNHFSIINNTEETIHFLRDFTFVAKRNNLTLDLSTVTNISIDAITALVAVIEGLGVTRLVRGTIPTDDRIRGILIESGFFEHVKSRRLLPAPKQGRIGREESKKVEPRLARDLIHIGTEAVRGLPQRCPAAYRVLIECMSNTHNHAAGKQDKLGGKETWYSTVYGDPTRARVCYTFLDTGVGIFRSVQIGAVKRAYRYLNIRNNCDILRDILEGKIESSTCLPYRGKGLPSIFERFRFGKISSLIIIANDVFGNVGTNDFRILTTQFPGTLLYWETQEEIADRGIQKGAQTSNILGKVEDKESPNANI